MVLDRVSPSTPVSITTWWIVHTAVPKWGSSKYLHRMGNRRSCRVYLVSHIMRSVPQAEYLPDEHSGRTLSTFAETMSTNVPQSVPQSLSTECRRDKQGLWRILPPSGEAVYCNWPPWVLFVFLRFYFLSDSGCVLQVTHGEMRRYPVMMFRSKARQSNQLSRVMDSMVPIW